MMQNPNKDLSAFSDEELLIEYGNAIIQHSHGTGYDPKIHWGVSRRACRIVEEEILKRMKKDARNEG